MFSRALGRLIFKVSRWSFEPPPDFWAERQVLVCFPHTSLLDAFLTFAYFGIVGRTARALVKQEAFFWPLSSLLNLLGAVPVRRNSGQGVVEQMVARFSEDEEFSLCIMPEGTRKGVKRVRTGFWHIARGLALPITCCYADHERRRVCWIGQIHPSDDLEADLKRIAALYQARGHSIPAETSS